MTLTQVIISSEITFFIVTVLMLLYHNTRRLITGNGLYYSGNRIFTNITSL